MQCYYSTACDVAFKYFFTPQCTSQFIWVQRGKDGLSGYFKGKTPWVWKHRWWTMILIKDNPLLSTSKFITDEMLGAKIKHFSDLAPTRMCVLHLVCVLIKYDLILTMTCRHYIVQGEDPGSLKEHFIYDWNHPWQWIENIAN